MKVVIDIPDRLYEEIKSDYKIVIYGGMRSGKTLLSTLLRAVRNGTPLLKEHKRTIDADELLKRIAEKAKTPSLSEATVNGLCGATAIIYDMLIESGQEKE